MLFSAAEAQIRSICGESRLRQFLAYATDISKSTLRDLEIVVGQYSIVAEHRKASIYQIQAG